jgi:hypothetical protein
MTSESVVEVGKESVFFRFEGDRKHRANTCGYVKTVDLAIKREDLAFYENSLLSKMALYENFLLSKMAHKKWNERCGLDASTPLVTQPMSELKTEWSEGIVDMISHI